VAISEDSWLSERFGHPVFSVSAPAGLAEHAAGQERAAYQARVDAEDVEAVAALEAAGMRVVNVTATLGTDPARALPEARVEVREAGPEHHDALAGLAARSFRHSRFHLDPEVPTETANRIKHDWVSSYVRGVRGDELLVALRGSEPVGFLCGMDRDGGDRRVRVIDLIGVAPEAQGAGAGTALVRAFHERAVGRCDAVEVGTQVANVPAMAFYERLGYVVTRAAYDLHMHVR
jgi:ribosomal protein S18 acetylase RimI-like enzyme